MYTNQWIEIEQSWFSWNSCPTATYARRGASESSVVVHMSAQSKRGRSSEEAKNPGCFEATSRDAVAGGCFSTSTRFRLRRAGVIHRIRIKRFHGRAHPEQEFKFAPPELVHSWG